MSEYGQLKAKGMGRGRPRHTPEQREKSLAVNAMRQEARRRAHIVLKNRHSDEYADIYEAELSALSSEKPQPRQKRTRK